MNEESFIKTPTPRHTSQWEETIAEVQKQASPFSSTLDKWDHDAVHDHRE
jgi:hypothetical protein